MAAKTGTYTLINSTTLTTATASVSFSSIPGTYTDLVLVANYGITTDYYAPRIRFNSDTGSNYSDTIISGNGSTASSERHTNATSIVISSTGVLSNTLNNITIMNLNDYSNTTTYKTLTGRNSAAANEASSGVGLWRNTNAINSITIFLGSGNLYSGSTFKLYGIEAGNL